MKYLNLSLTHLFLLLIILGTTTCKQAKQEKQNAVDVSKYILSHSSYQVAIKDQIYVRFNNLPYDKNRRKTTVDPKVISISPKVKGEFVWRDNQTIDFKSTETFDYETRYEVRVNLNELYDNALIEEYSFEVTTDQLYFSVVESILKPNFNGSPDSLSLSVELRTNALLKADNLKDYFTLSRVDKPLLFENFVNKNNDLYLFEIAPISKDMQSKNIRLNWEVPKSNIKGSQEFRVPAKSEFDIMSVNVTNIKSGHVKVVFSNQLGNQKFDGLIRVENYNGKYKFTSKGNQLDIYVDSDIVGNHNLIFDKNIKDINNFSLKKEERFPIQFIAKKPQLRVTNKGTIVPYTNQVIYPFEAVALDTVEVQIFKIFDNNILDFLRYNNLNSTYVDHFFGRVVHDQKIVLKNINNADNSHDWVHYALDLQKLTKVDPGAIYQVRIGFKKSFSNFNCDDKKDVPVGRNHTDSSFERFRYYDGYSYGHQSDPCYPAYYNRDKFIYQNLLASNLGLIVKRGKKNNIKIITSDLESSNPLSNVNIKVYDVQQQVMSESKTDGQGMVDIVSERKARYVVANYQNNYAYISLEDNKSNSLSSFDVSGVSQYGDINGFLFGERGVWRPGDTLHLSYMLYDKKNTIASNHPINMLVKDSKGKVKYDVSTSDNQNGYYVFNIPTMTSDPTGSWTAIASLGNMKTSKRLKIETVKPNRIKIDLDFKNDELDVSGKEPFLLEAKWLHGAPASDLKSQVDVKYSNAPVQFENYDKFTFTDPARKVNSTLTNVFNGVTDSKGQKEVSIKFGSDFYPPAKLKANFRTRVFEKSGNYSEDFTSVNVNPYESYVGVFIAQDRWGDYSINTNKNEAIEIVALDKKGIPQKNKKLNIGIYNASWRWWYRRNSSNIFQYNSSEHYSAEEKAVLKTDAQGRIFYKPELNGYGSYMVRVCDTESGHCTGQLFYSDSYSKNNTEDGQVAKLNFSTDKQVYEVGEKVTLKVPTSADSKILVSLENNQEVLDAFWVDATGDETTIPFVVRQEMLPNVYIHTSLIQNVNRQNDLPVRLYGVTSIKVEDPKTKLHPVIQCADEFEPNTNVDIAISEENGKEMSYTLAVVDEGLLDITNFNTPNPSKHFFAKQSLGVKSWDIYDMVLNRYGDNIAKIFSVGGDGTGSNEAENPSANRFKSVVKFLGPFTVKNGETNNHKIEIPNYIGAVRIMVVGKNRKAFGKVDKNVVVKKPLMLLSTLPRVLAPGEKLLVPVNVFAYQDDIKQVTVNAEGDDFLISKGPTEKEMAFEKQGDKLTHFDFAAGDKTGIAHFNFKVSSGTYSADENIEIDIRNPSPRKTEVYSQLLESGESWNKEFNNLGIKGSNEATVEISKFPSFNLNDRLRYLIRYPYGCVEQTTSSVFPQLYLEEISNLSEGKKRRIKGNIQSGIRRLMGFQTSRGGLSYWPGSSSDNDWGTSYAGHFILEARSKGYFVNDGFINRWVAYQKKASDQYVDSKYDYVQRSQAYRLYTLALAGQANLSAMNRLRVSNIENKLTRFLLAASYALVGQDDVARQLIENLDYVIKDYQEMSYSYGSGLRDRSLILLTLLKIGDQKKSFELALDIANKLGQKKWYSTQTTAFGLMSLTKFLATQKNDMLNYNFDFDNLMKVEHESEEALDVYDLDLAKIENHKFTLTNKSNGSMYVRILSSGKPLPAPMPSYANGLDLDVAYKNQRGEKIDPAVLPQGTDFMAEVTVRNTSTNGRNYKELALNHTLPSGWEIQNLRLGDMQNANVNNNSRSHRDRKLYDFQDIRDDRVYTFFDLNAGASKTFEVNLTATYAGEFFMPNITCEAMYDKAISASHQGAWIKVEQE